MARPHILSPRRVMPIVDVPIVEADMETVDFWYERARRFLALPGLTHEATPAELPITCNRGWLSCELWIRGW